MGANVPWRSGEFYLPFIPLPPRSSGVAGLLRKCFVSDTFAFQAQPSSKVLHASITLGRRCIHCPSMEMPCEASLGGVGLFLSSVLRSLSSSGSCFRHGVPEPTSGPFLQTTRDRAECYLLYHFSLRLRHRTDAVDVPYARPKRRVCMRILRLWYANGPAPDSMEAEPKPSCLVCTPPFVFSSQTILEGDLLSRRRASRMIELNFSLSSISRLKSNGSRRQRLLEAAIV